MDSTAIELIQQTAIDADGRRLPAEVAHAVAALPANYELTSLEKYYPNRFRFRGRMTTESLADFVTYTKQHPGGHGFIVAAGLEATVFFNLGDVDKPGHADWSAGLAMKMTPAMSALRAINGRALDQRGVTDFLEDWSPLVRAYTQQRPNGEEEEVRLVQAVAAIRRIKIEAKSASETTQQNFKESQSRLDSVEASSDEGLPDVLEISTAPYFGLPVRDFRLRLSILTGGDKPMLKFRLIGADRHEEDIAQEFKSILLDEIGDAATMTIGEFRP